MIESDQLIIKFKFWRANFLILGVCSQTELVSL